MSFGKTITLSTGAKMPQIGLGTWLVEPDEAAEEVVEHAVRVGYRLIDCAKYYFNQRGVRVGNGLKKVIPSVVKREDLFISSKLWNNSHKAELVEKALDDTLDEFGLDYLDLYLIHWPVAFKAGDDLMPLDPSKEGFVDLDIDTPYIETWKAVNDLLKTGKVRAVGVSNLSLHNLKAVVDATGIVPAVNQVEGHPGIVQDDLAAYCKEKNIVITAYSPLGHNPQGFPQWTDSPVVESVAKKLNATPAQVLIAFSAYSGYVVIPKSAQKDRIESNFQQIELPETEFKEILKLGILKPIRFYLPIQFEPRWDISVFDDREEEGATHKVTIT